MEEMPSLDEQICFALYNASRALTARYRDLLEPLGLTYPQYLVFVVLWRGGPVTVSQLGDRLHLDSGTLSPLLRRLEAAGLLTRTRVSTDERSVLVTATAAGVALEERATGIPAQICAATGLDLEALQVVTAQVNGIGEHVRATG